MVGPNPLAASVEMLSLRWRGVAALLPSAGVAQERSRSPLLRRLTASHATPNEGTATPVPKEVYGSIRQVKTSPQKLNLVAKLIRRRSIAEALAQLQFCEKKAARFVLNTLLDTQRRAVAVHGVDPLNLHIVESFVGKATYLKRIRYHGKGMSGEMHKYYSHYFLKLREGPPPKKPEHKDKPHLRTRWLVEAGPRSIAGSL